MQRLADLPSADTSSGGWTQLVDTKSLACFTKPAEGKYLFMRASMELDIPAGHALDCFIPKIEEASWVPMLEKIEVLRNLGPDDKVVRYTMKLPWALRYIMSVPTCFELRNITRHDWPEPGQSAYASIPSEKTACGCARGQASVGQRQKMCEGVEELLRVPEKAC